MLLTQAISRAVVDAAELLEKVVDEGFLTADEAKHIVENLGDTIVDIIKDNTDLNDIQDKLLQAVQNLLQAFRESEAGQAAGDIAEGLNITVEQLKEKVDGILDILVTLITRTLANVFRFVVT